MLSKEECFHKWFGEAMPDMQKETTNLVNHICISTTSAYLAGWDECAWQSKGSAEQRQSTTQGEKCLCELECNSGLGRNILEINEHCPVHGKFWA
jgi:hypothetical protein